jgi:hypothetical protein
MDNSGFELFCDLMLADALILAKFAATVTFHLKGHPTYIAFYLSDVADLLAMLLPKISINILQS